MTDRKRRQNLAKCCSVSLRSWMNQWNCSEVNVLAQGLGKIFQLWALKCGTCLIFSWKIVVIIIQSGLKLYDLTVIAAGVQMNEFVIAPFAQRWQRSQHVLIWSNWRQNSPILTWNYEYMKFIYLNCGMKNRRGQGSNPGKPDFFRLSFRNCISCVINNCEGLLYIYLF